MSLFVETAPTGLGGSAAPQIVPPEGALLERVFLVLNRAEIPWCVLHGYENYPYKIGSDVDLLIGRGNLRERLLKILIEAEDELEARVVQWLDDRAQFIVLAGTRPDGAPFLLQLHVSADYEMNGRVFHRGEEIFKNRQRRGKGYWVPAAAMEFGCVLANRISKEKLTSQHCDHLCDLYDQDPAGCGEEICRYFTSDTARLLTAAAASNDWIKVLTDLPRLHAELDAGRGAAKPGQIVATYLRKLRRWMNPQCGYHAVFLGPDGVGKSTIIETFQRDLAPAFLHSKYLTFAPSMLPGKYAVPKPDGPHSLPPRSFSASLLKAAWWLGCYTVGYALGVRPTLARGGLVVNHRYLVDAIVDQKRYRYSGPVALLRAIWSIAPKPNAVFLLDAPAEVIQERKQEVPFHETARQREAYLNVVQDLPIGRVIDADQEIRDVANEVEWIVLDQMADRVAKRVGVGGKR